MMKGRGVALGLEARAESRSSGLSRSSMNSSQNRKHPGTKPCCPPFLSLKKWTLPQKENSAELYPDHEFLTYRREFPFNQRTSPTSTGSGKVTCLN
jgi:hypothetical protein